jgi:putative membrane-bound dehydrogenase-like protein
MYRLLARISLVFVLGLVACSGTRPLPAPAPTHAEAALPAEPVDRTYMLEAWMLGYRGVGGDIDGVRNPVLRAAPGETVRLTLVGVEPLLHDVAMEQLGIKSAEVTAVGEQTHITFTAQENDVYYCTIPGHRAAGMEGRFEVIQPGEAVVAGVEVRENGASLNLGFETGFADGWTATGEAFAQGPLRGDAVFLRTSAQRSRHEGTFWMSSSELVTPQATGTLTSAAFAVTHPYAAFRVAGGALKDTRVELVEAETNTVFFEITGNNHPTLRPVVVDLSDRQGYRVYLRLIDQETGVSTIPYIPDNEWAFISFDDFRFYPSRPVFPDELRPSDIQILPPLDVLPFAGLAGRAAAEAMTVPEGFRVRLAAAEPEIVRPIAFTLDDRGRLWVVEANTYPVRAPEGEGQDRIYIFEDTDGDGTLDRRTVFMEGLNLVSGIEVGFGGVWLGAAPYLLFIPIEPGTDRPAGPPQVLLDGWGYTDTHETLNSFRWGPDGWLYGTHGVFVDSNVGKPGAADSERVRLNAGVWRYHPQRHVFELFSEGTSNPWGIDFDDYGQGFITACVIPHLYHVIPGARYQRQAGQHFNPYTYDDLKTHADHVHWVGTYGPHAGNNRSDAAGGGHAHAGAMVYLGGSWPQEYRNQLFMNNIHGARTNMDVLERQGSGYVARHGADFLRANDAWSQMVSLQYGPDGGVYLIDWYDKNQCHSPNPDVHQKTLGRIFKVSHQNDRWAPVNLADASDEALVAMQVHANDWYVRHARRLLQERGPNPQVHAALWRILRENPDVTRRLRALWALHVTGGLTEAQRLALLSDADEYLRGWAVQLIAETRQIPAPALTRMGEMARAETSAFVRLQLAAALQRVPPAQRWEVLAGLYGHAEDAADHNLPLMVWYAAEPLAALDMRRALAMAVTTPLPGILPYTVQRLVALGGPEAVQTLSEQLAQTPDPARQKELLKGLNQLLGSQ